MGPVRMEHFLVLTDDIDGTRDFYCSTLGMRDGFRPDGRFRRGRGGRPVSARQADSHSASPGSR